MINFTAFTIDSRRLVGPQRAIRRSLKKKKNEKLQVLASCFHLLMMRGQEMSLLVGSS